MAFTIIKAEDKVHVSKIKTILYGEPGQGKSSLAFSALNPLCLDFDNGAHRSMNRKDILRIDNWEDLIQAKRDGVFDAYGTIIFDTLDKMLDYMTVYIQSNEWRAFGAKPGSLSNVKTGALTLKGFGVLKSLFISFMNSVFLENTGNNPARDVIMIAHCKDDKDNDDIFKIPKITGGSYSFAMESADIIGYVAVEGKDYCVDFQPSQRNRCKDGGRIGKVYIPDLCEKQLFFHDLLNTARKNMGNVNAKNLEVMNEVKALKKDILAAEDAEALNLCRARMEAAGDWMRSNVANEMLESVMRLDVVFDKVNKVFRRKDTAVSVNESVVTNHNEV